MREEEQREASLCSRCVCVSVCEGGKGGGVKGTSCSKGLWEYTENKKDACAALKSKEEDKVGERPVPRPTPKAPHLE